MQNNSLSEVNVFQFNLNYRQIILLNRQLAIGRQSETIPLGILSDFRLFSKLPIENLDWNDSRGKNLKAKH